MILLVLLPELYILCAVVVNRANQLEQTVNHINAIITAEKLRACRQIVMSI